VDHHRSFIAEKRSKEGGQSVEIYIVKPEKPQGMGSVMMIVSTDSALSA
jgi:hypothetical protein